MRPVWRTALLAALVAAPAGAQQPAAADPRADLRRFAEVLETAVRKVSRPSPFQVLGMAGGARGYLLPGHGVVFVLPARALPGRRGVIVMRQRRPGDPAAVEVWRDHQPTRDSKAPGNEPEAGPQPAPQVAFVREMDRQLQQMEAQVEAFQAEAERASQEAERALSRVEQQIRVRFPQADGSFEVTVAAPPGAAPAQPPAPASPPAAPVPPTPPAAAAGAPPPTPPSPPQVAAPPVPPWRFWFPRQDEDDTRSAESVIGDVRAAITQALEAQGHSLRIVRPEDSLTVAVDFTFRGFALHDENARSDRTLVLRVRKRDLDERQAGRLASPELQKRIEVAEY